MLMSWILLLGLSLVFLFLRGSLAIMLALGFHCLVLGAGILGMFFSRFLWGFTLGGVI